MNGQCQLGQPIHHRQVVVIVLRNEEGKIGKPHGGLQPGVKGGARKSRFGHPGNGFHGPLPLPSELGQNLRDGAAIVVRLVSLAVVEVGGGEQGLSFQKILDVFDPSCKWVECKKQRICTTENITIQRDIIRLG